MKFGSLTFLFKSILFSAYFLIPVISSLFLKTIKELGMPEARIAMAQAVEFIAKAKKSNKAIMAIDSAMADIEAGLDFMPPNHLRDAHYKDAHKYGVGGYIYTHNHPDVYQEFMPDELVGKKYFN